MLRWPKQCRENCSRNAVLMPLIWYKAAGLQGVFGKISVEDGVGDDGGAIE
jgi:hypothetical protein